jgi:hypothetical protein
MTQIMVDIDRSRDTVILSMEPATVRIYAAAAQERGYPGVTELIEALLADWPAILAPVAHEPKGAVTGAQDFPFGGTF